MLLLLLLFILLVFSRRDMGSSTENNKLTTVKYIRLQKHMDHEISHLAGTAEHADFLPVLFVSFII